MENAAREVTLVKSVKRNMYKWHRVLGILTVIPVIFWALSGLCHPIIAHWFKVPVAHEYIKPVPVDTAQIKISLKEVLNLQGFSVFRNAGLINLNATTYYQVKSMTNHLYYFSAKDGSALANGDELYAAYLGSYFLGDSTAKIKTIENISDFDGEYQYVNRLLPVWKLSFDREDKMDVYVETFQSRLANYNDNSRKVFLWVFRNFHSYAFLEKITNNTVRYAFILVCAAIVICSTLSGLLIYGLLWNKFKKPNDGQKRGFLRRNHRTIGIAVAIVTLSFIGSGAYHASRKFTPDERILAVYQPEINISELGFSLNDLPLNWNQVINVSLVRFDNKTYYQVRKMNQSMENWGKQQVSQAAAMFDKENKKNSSDFEYYSTDDGSLLPDGTMAHSRSLAKYFMGNTAIPSLLSTQYLTKFEGDYGFVNKRLPVMKMSFDTPSHLTYYLELATGRLAAKVEDSDRREGLSFAVFHKYMLADVAGKNFRDLLTAFAALGVLAVSISGLILFLKTK